MLGTNTDLLILQWKILRKEKVVFQIRPGCFLSTQSKFSFLQQTWDDVTKNVLQCNAPTRFGNEFEELITVMRTWLILSCWC